MKLTKEYYNANEVAHMIGMAGSSIRYQISKGAIEGAKVGERWIVPKKEVKRLLDEYVIDIDNYYTTNEVCEILNIKKSSVIGMFKRGKLNGKKFAGKLYFEKEYIEKLKEERILKYEKYYTIKEVSEMLNVHSTTINQWLLAGKIKGQKLSTSEGRTTWVIDKKSADEFILFKNLEKSRKIQAETAIEREDRDYITGCVTKEVGQKIRERVSDNLTSISFEAGKILTDYFNKTEQVDLFEKVRAWAEERGIDKAEPSKQMLKVCEELGETAGAIARGNKDDLVDSLGDLLVTIIILAQQNNLSLEACLASAYDEIEKRKGKTINGVFVKESDLN